MRSMFPAALTMFSLIALGGPARAATTFYVATTGADTGACGTSAAPCKTVQAALDKTDDGDTVIVRSGTYNECIYVFPGSTGIGGVTLTTEAYFNNQTIGAATLDGTPDCDSDSGAPGPVVVIYDGSTLSGFAVKHGGDSAIWGFGAVHITGNSVTLSDTSTIGGGIWVSTGLNLTDPTAKTQINGNTVDQNTSSYDGAGIYVDAFADGVPSVVEIKSNTVTNNTGGAGSGAFGSGITVFSDTAAASDTSTVTITSNTIDGNTALNSGDGVYFAYGGGIFVATGSSSGFGTETVTVGVKGSGNIVRNNVSEGYGGGMSLNLQPAAGSKHTIVAEGNSVTANTGNKAGGGIHVYGSSFDVSSGTNAVHVQDNTLTGNHALGTPADFFDRGGGGVFAELYSYRSPSGINDYEIKRNTITGNDAATLGGGLSLLVVASDDPLGDGATAPTDTAVTISNNLIATNKALDLGTSTGRGGGEYALVEAFGDQATASVDHDFLTVAANDTDTGAGGLEWDAYPAANSLGSTGSTALSLTNSIIVSNQGVGVGGFVTPGPGVAVDITYDDAFGNTPDWEAQLGIVPGTTLGVISVDPTLDPLSYAAPLCSATIDAGDPNVDATAETAQPNGGLVNLGHLGNTSSATQTFPDINGDGFVDGLDVLGLAVSFNASFPSARFNAAADLDLNNTVDGLDLADLVPFYARACP